jgi:hypothetical protein
VTASHETGGGTKETVLAQRPNDGRKTTFYTDLGALSQPRRWPRWLFIRELFQWLIVQVAKLVYPLSHSRIRQPTDNSAESKLRERSGC